MNKQSSKFTAIVVATIAAGIPIWTVSSRDLNMTEPSFLGVWFLIGIVVTVLAIIFTNMDTRELIGAITAGFLIAVMIRYMADMFFGSARHSLIGMELLIAAGIGACSSWIGSFTYHFQEDKKPSKK